MILTHSGKPPELGQGVIVAPTAVVIGNVKIDHDSSVWFSAAVRADYGPVRIGARTSIQDGAVIHVTHTQKGDLFPTHIGSDCVIGHGAVVEGCTINDGCLIGMNAVVLPKAEIGTGAVVAAGAVVTEGQILPPFTLVAGAPAKIKRQFDGPNPALGWTANEYVQLKEQYLSNEDLTP
jgi:carbonic anhydrase/acetyltransferase-like protein (isoleucine patch superfamily)